MSEHLRSASCMFGAAVGLFFAGVALAAPGTSATKETVKPELKMIWSIEGGAYGSSRSLEPTLAITSDRLLVDANVTKGDRRYEVIRAFDAKTGRLNGQIEHPDGEPFEGLGDSIAINDQFLVTALSGKAQFGRDGEILVYNAKTFELLSRIKNPRDADSAFFGLNGVVLQGDRILTAVTLSADNISTAWVFSAETGEVLLRIDDPDVPKVTQDKPRRSFFGRALAMNETHIAIAAHDRDGPMGLSTRGIVYVFDARDGSLQYRLKTPGSNEATWFGSSLIMSDDRLYVTGLDETGPLEWPTGMVYAYDLATAELQFTIAEPSVPKNDGDFSAGQEGSGFPTNLSVDGPFLFSGLPDWSQNGTSEGGLIVFDARTGEPLLTYGHERGEKWGAFGTAIAADHGYLAVMQDMPNGGPGAVRVTLFEVKTP